ncbi:hypothetical protein ZPR_0669 [Zunongwangia profunda SM-A87]|uniref:Uncharacterized protein n=1 Tax=Zunongwangia profunda (strain DSM 18752 / CCTCC AB 206139 / SM-A87) TaxID=655815 RepID=D5BFT0_ZUNPS|nr:hypothetical protein ZPR_0669 [Zunongwangia profunda SM-A87]
MKKENKLMAKSWQLKAEKAYKTFLFWLCCCFVWQPKHNN